MGLNKKSTPLMKVSDEKKAFEKLVSNIFSNKEWRLLERPCIEKQFWQVKLWTGDLLKSSVFNS